MKGRIEFGRKNIVVFFFIWKVIMISRTIIVQGERGLKVGTYSWRVSSRVDIKSNIIQYLYSRIAEGKDKGG